MYSFELFELETRMLRAQREQQPQTIEGLTLADLLAGQRKPSLGRRLHDAIAHQLQQWRLQRQVHHRQSIDLSQSRRELAG
jgi:hypothetical protein